MKPNAPSLAQLTVAAVPATPDQNSTLDQAPTAPGCVPILLSFDLLQDALPQFEADCSLLALATARNVSRAADIALGAAA